MFDDPQKELKRLEDELLKKGMEEEEFERFYHDVFEEFGEAPEEAPAPAPVKKPKNTYADTPRAVAPQKKKGIRGPLITVCLELVGIAAVIGYWLLKLL